MASEITYRLREELEDRDSSQQGGFNGLLTAALGGFPVYTRLNALEDFHKVRPRVDLKVEVGAATGRRFLCPDGVLRFDAFHFTVGLQVVTNPRNVQQDNEIHEQMLSTCRLVMSRAGGNSTFLDNLNFPNVYLGEHLRDTGMSDSTVDEDNGLEYTTISYEGIVCVRPNAWN